MKRVRINAGFIGLVFKRKNYDRIITEGSHWLKPGETVTVYDLTKQFTPAVDLNLLLKDQRLAEQLIIVEVGDNEIALQFINGNFRNVFYAGRYAFWKGLNNFNFIKADTSKTDIPDEIPGYLLGKAEILPLIRVLNIESFEKAILIVNGEFQKTLNSGTYYFWKNQTPVSALKADMRQQQMELSGQELLTKDKANIRISFFAGFKVTDIEKALIANKDFEKQLYILLQLALRDFIGNMTLDEILERKEDIALNVMQAVNPKTIDLGVEISYCGMRDIILPGDVKEIMNQVLIAEKKAQANIIARREETASTRSLMNTARLLEENAMLLKLKEMEYVEKITEKVSNISISGNAQMLDQLKSIFSPAPKQ